MPNPLEIWKTIPSLRGYEASNLGQIRTLWEFQYAINAKTGRSYYSRKAVGTHWTLVEPKCHEHGYVTNSIRVHNENRKSNRGWYWTSVGALVLEAHVKPRPYYKDGHLDGDITNNHVGNLVWALQEEHRELLRKSARCKIKLSSEQVVAIKKRLDCGEKGVALAREYDVSSATITYIRNGSRKPVMA